MTSEAESANTTSCALAGRLRRDGNHRQDLFPGFFYK
jgi:hypothetical protein